MARGRRYRIKNIKTGEYLPGIYSNSEAQKACGVNWDISQHALKGNVIAKTYKLEIVIESGEDSWLSEWCKEWDEARLKLLQTGGKCLKV